MSKNKGQRKKQEILHWNTKNNNGMSVVVGKASTGKSSILRLSELRKEYLTNLQKSLSEQVVIDRACSAKKLLDKITKTK